MLLNFGEVIFCDVCEGVGVDYMIVLNVMLIFLRFVFGL